MAKRLLALVAAALMVGIALWVRDGGSTESASDGPAPDTSDDGIVCAADFDAICAAAGLDGSTEPAGTTADRLLEAQDAADLGGGAWIVTSAWADLVLAERERLGLAPLFSIDSAPLASSTVVTVIWQDRAAELEARCGALDWTCLADEADATLAGGDRVQTALPHVDSAHGLVVAAHQAASLLGRTDFAANDFDAAFAASVRALAGDQRGTPVLALRSRGPGELTAVGTVAAAADPLSSTFATLEARMLAPATRADVVALVPAGSTLDGGARAALAQAFTDAGYDPAPGGTDDGLPAGGVLAAIRTLWTDSA